MERTKTLSHYAPIILFVYNRPWHTQQTVEALQKNELAAQSKLIIYSDGPKNENACSQVQAVRDYLKTITGFESIKIIERIKNWGLAANIIDGVSEVVNQYGSTIVMEDDLVCSTYFLQYMNKALNYYQSDDRVFAISGYNDLKLPANFKKDVFFAHISTSWGWAVWKKEWGSINWDNEHYINLISEKSKYDDFYKKVGRNRLEMLHQQLQGKIDSWAIRRLFSQLNLGKRTVFPKDSFIMNIGLDGTGVHCKKNDTYNKKNNLCSREVILSDYFENDQIDQMIFKKNTVSYFEKILRKLSRIFD